MSSRLLSVWKQAKIGNITLGKWGEKMGETVRICLSRAMVAGSSSRFSMPKTVSPKVAAPEPRKAEPSQKEPRKQDKRVQRSRAAIRKALLALLEDEDFDKVSVTAVARKAGVDRKTFYKHYASIDEVFDDAVRERALVIADALYRQTSHIDRRVDVAEMFQLLSYAMVKETWLTDRTLSHMPSDVLLDKIEDPLIAVFTEQDVLGIADQMGPNAEYGVAFFVCGLLGAFRRWLASDSELPLEQLSASVGTAVAMGLEGILAAHR